MIVACKFEDDEANADDGQKNAKFGALVRKRTKTHRPVIENKLTLQGPNFHARISKKNNQ